MRQLQQTLFNANHVQVDITCQAAIIAYNAFLDAVLALRQDAQLVIVDTIAQQVQLE